MLQIEKYLNEQLRKAIQINGESEEDIHDMRVAIRKYFDVLYTLYPIYENIECIFLAKEAISTLGKVRDIDICGIINMERDKLVFKALKRVKNMQMCFINERIYGARILLYNRILDISRSVKDISDFHELRKNVRIVRNLAEALGYDNKEIKILAKRMGDLRDEMLRARCRGQTPTNVNLDEYREEARRVILKIIALQDEFHHFNTNGG
ncbi:CHAD domain-containing protein [Sulfolobus tengchongensis]|uniref:CHAD domain-containing protein n=1 Tax=Sulfolobus tengchongensis TaxID=207809 RepID=A0AAX4KX60_9CREN